MNIGAACKEFSVHNSGAELIRLIPALRGSGSQGSHTALLIMKIFESINPELQSELGDCYHEGNCVTKDSPKALALFCEAARRGSARSQYDLGWYYYKRNEYLRAVEFFELCISRKDELQEKDMGAIYACLGDAYTRLSEPKISSAIEMLTIAADKYHEGYACRRLGDLYAQTGTNHFSAEKAIKNYEQGASYGDTTSTHLLAISYILGNEELGIEVDLQKAERLLLPLAGKSDYHILRDLGLLYQEGEADGPVPMDLQKSKQYYERALELRKSPLLASDLGYVYYRLSEYKKAEEMLAYADAEDYRDKSDFLGRMYKDGLLGSKDLNKAAYYYGRAYEKDALNNLFTFAEYAELLECIGSYAWAYDVAAAGETRFNDICFVFIQASLVLNGHLGDRMPLHQAAERMELCVSYKTNLPEAHMALGRYYLYIGEYRKAEKNYMDAFSLGVPEAAVLLGRLYEKGGGTIPASPSRAYEWYLRAANAGSEIGKAEADCFRKGMFGGIKRYRNL